MAKLYRWSARTVLAEGERTVVVAAYTRAEGLERLTRAGVPISMADFKKWGQTGNKAHCLVARRPGVWVELDRYSFQQLGKE